MPTLSLLAYMYVGEVLAIVKNNKICMPCSFTETEYVFYVLFNSSKDVSPAPQRNVPRAPCVRPAIKKTRKTEYEKNQSI